MIVLPDDDFFFLESAIFRLNSLSYEITENEQVWMNANGN